MPGRGGRSLQRGLDGDVYQAVLPLLESTQRHDVSTLYQHIQRSNSSLKRKPKKVLEDSLDRVLDAYAAEKDDVDEEAIAEQRQERREPSPSANIMNRAITSSWKLPVNPAPPSSAVANGGVDGSKKRDANGEPPKKRRKPAEEVDRSAPSDVKLEDLGGIDEVIEQLGDLLILPLTKPDVYTRMNVPLPRGILLHGPPGCGKSMLARAYAAKLGVPFVEIMGPSIVSGMSGESEKQVRDLFEEARKLAPCIIFIDEIDVIAPKRESSQSQMEKRIVAQLLISIDSLALESKNSGGKPVIVIAATNRPDSLDSALRRGGRFDTEINMGVPNESMRAAILRTQTRETPLDEDVDFERLAKMTAGFVGADLRDLVGKAGAWALKLYKEALKKQALDADTNMDIDGTPQGSKVIQGLDCLLRRLRDTSRPEPEGFDDPRVSMEAFLSVLPGITPSSKREGFATVPDTTWDDVGALKSVRKQLEAAIVGPLQNPERYAQVGISVPTGVLLWGPPGCGKTLLAKAVAAESKANFISIKGPELINKYVGESERAVRTLFNRARSSAPCVIFFDELDALVPRRDDSLSEASSRVVNTLLTELDGLSARAGIYVIAATNRPDIIDEAMLRPGRLETLLFVDLPGPNERVEILKALINSKTRRNVKYPSGIEELVRDEKCKMWSGADLEALLRKVGQHAIDAGRAELKPEDFEKAIEQIRPSVTDVQKYYKLRARMDRAT